MNIIELYNLLRNKIGEKEAQYVTEYISLQIEERLAEKKDILATKEDIFQLRVELKEQKADLLKWMIVLFALFYIGMIVFLIKQFL